MAVIKFGHGDDGSVVVIIYSTLNDKPVETALNFSASNARQIAAELMKTAEVAEQVKRGGLNGDGASPN